MQTLFTPGPVATTESVKQAMMLDCGQRTPFFLNIVTHIRQHLLEIAGADPADHTAILIQGSGTYAIEATLHTCVAEHDKVLVVSNGYYGDLMAQILSKQKRKFTQLAYKENELIRPQEVIAALDSDPSLTHVCLVQSETSGGTINPIDFLRQYPRPIHVIVDAVSSFGAYHVNQRDNRIDFVVAVANKCLQAPPGCAFVVARKDTLNKYKNNASSTVLDLWDQDDFMNRTLRFRTTPPTHVLVAFEQALREFQSQGGIDGRFERYQSIQRRLMANMRELGFRGFLDDEYQGVILTTFHLPEHPNFNFIDMQTSLEADGLIIFNEKTTQAPTFRIGSIGELSLAQIDALTNQIRKYLEKNGVTLTEVELHQ